MKVLHAMYIGENKMRLSAELKYLREIQDPGYSSLGYARKSIGINIYM